MAHALRNEGMLMHVSVVSACCARCADAVATENVTLISRRLVERMVTSLDVHCDVPDVPQIER